MRPSRARSSGLAASPHMRSSVVCITTTSESEFLVHTRLVRRSNSISRVRMCDFYRDMLQRSAARSSGRTWSFTKGAKSVRSGACLTSASRASALRPVAMTAVNVNVATTTFVAVVASGLRRHGNANDLHVMAGDHREAHDLGCHSRAKGWSLPRTA
jgi:hypothetical protein